MLTIISLVIRIIRSRRINNLDIIIVITIIITIIIIIIIVIKFYYWYYDCSAWDSSS